MTKPKLILASASPRRLSILADAGIVPAKILPASINETPHRRELPRDLAQRLALEKLRAIQKLEPETYILSADTVVAVGRRILPKAESPEEVRQCWELMSGRRHHVYTSVVVCGITGKTFQGTVDSVVIFRRVSREEIEDYIKCGEGIGKAGGYGIQGCAAMFIRFMSGSYTNIVGLPMFETAQLLRRCGYLT